MFFGVDVIKCCIAESQTGLDSGYPARSGVSAESGMRAWRFAGARSSGSTARLNVTWIKHERSQQLSIQPLSNILAPKGFTHLVLSITAGRV